MLILYFIILIISAGIVTAIYFYKNPPFDFEETLAGIGTGILVGIFWPVVIPIAILMLIVYIISVYVSALFKKIENKITELEEKAEKENFKY